MERPACRARGPFDPQRMLDALPERRISASLRSISGWLGVGMPERVSGGLAQHGAMIERDHVLEATQAAAETPVESPAASNQPVNNAA